VESEERFMRGRVGERLLSKESGCEGLRIWFARSIFEICLSFFLFLVNWGRRLLEGVRRCAVSFEFPSVVHIIPPP